jgi:putative spermidine/putrescine transport system ATP-binding protein
LEVTPDDNGNGRVVAPTYLGSLGRVEVRLDDGTSVLAQVPSHQATQLAPGTPVRVTVRPTPVLAVPADA